MGDYIYESEWNDDKTEDINIFGRIECVDSGVFERKVVTIHVT